MLEATKIKVDDAPILPNKNDWYRRNQYMIIALTKLGIDTFYQRHKTTKKSVSNHTDGQEKEGDTATNTKDCMRLSVG